MPHGHAPLKEANLPFCNRNSKVNKPTDEQYFRVMRPAENRVPFVFNSPHSGKVYPKGFIAASCLDSLSLRKSEDFLVDELFAGVVPLGAPLLAADFPRAWLDVNREPYELDPQMFNAPLPDYVNSGSARVKGGLGTIARIVSENQEIYREKIDVEEGFERIATCYLPYHAALRGLLAEAIVDFGHAVLVDCHSMPSTPSGKPGRLQPRIRADFVLGDRFGSACAPEITAAAAAFLRELGFRVEINKPYAGGFITEHYGRPENGLHAIQIEINRALYMDEMRMEKSDNFGMLAEALAVFASRLVSIPEHGLAASIPLAAE